MGYYRAGFDVLGVDINPQRHYPFDFVQADAFLYLDGFGTGAFSGKFDAIHASPPCQDHSPLSATHAKHGTGWMLDATREKLQAIGIPWVLENVMGAPMNVGPQDLFGNAGGIVLCGSMFDLHAGEYQLRRHRQFEASFPMIGLACRHKGETIDVTGHSMQGRAYRKRLVDGKLPDTKADKDQAMGIDWMITAELSQAIPPAYTEFIGAQLLAEVQVNA